MHRHSLHNNITEGSDGCGAMYAEDSGGCKSGDMGNSDGFTGDMSSDSMYHSHNYVQWNTWD